MFYTGLTSVTFRKLNVSSIIQLAAEAGLDGIEWGGDIHVPSTDITQAARIAEETNSAGLRVLAYGSYFFLSDSENIQESFQPVLETAMALGTKLIRIWCGNRSPEDADHTYWEKMIENGRTVGNLCADKGVRVAFEYHRNSLTENSKSACRILQGIHHPSVCTGWQPNPDLSCSDNAKELKEIRSWLANIHVFHWQSGNRLFLQEGIADWQVYLDAIKDEDHALILEFVKDDQIEVFRQDAEALKNLIKR
jgi:sugar phosphate isomerase/epimerase